MASIDTSLLLSSYQNKQVRKTGDTLGKDDFLKLLMTQLQNQDPTNPMQDKDFIAQMAQFSTLEQITNMTSSIDKFVQTEQQNKMIAYNSFVGKNVTWHKLADNADSNAEQSFDTGSGRVASLQFKDDSVYFILDDGTKLEPANISQVNDTAASTGNNLFSASELIGKSVTWLDSSQNETTASVKSVSMKDGKTLFELNDAAGTKLSADQIIKIAGS
ncbi:flagellar hook assembly protein FlgD [Peribacillus sp. B-H-3]|uniref:flagellar hook assembly protein FlgD n=1 Tax=Peribacillus sp. B-H-3 TaxID=3400420 RepID=UPI003B02A0C4